MNPKEMAEHSAALIERYYQNDYMPFLENMDEKAVWYGPAIGQVIHGKQRMIETWKQEQHTLTFTLTGMKSLALTSHESYCDVMLSYTVVTHYPNGKDLSVYQRVMMTWCMRKEKVAGGKTETVPRILLCQVTNPHPMHEKDTIYPQHYAQVYAGTQVAPQNSEPLYFLGKDNARHHLLSDSVIWIESLGARKGCALHTVQGVTLEVNHTIAEMEQQYAHLFLRCHRSYLINPHYAVSVRRFIVKMSNGTLLPIPERKYVKIRTLLDKEI